MSDPQSAIFRGIALSNYFRVHPWRQSLFSVANAGALPAEGLGKIFDFGMLAFVTWCGLGPGVSCSNFVLGLFE